VTRLKIDPQNDAGCFLFTTFLEQEQNHDIC